ncbi:ABC transporter ATP-binding protein [Caballeronia sp. LZ035]|uniref:ABC transporter ATP-binding protein n=1 Tax=Caballeronia sp. LZ035 TaxID=3038568 RepID=UPI0028590C9E|nr:ABC transporter ATP-binding protein [Caballeronia sp. LZ035]MDR5763305.1 ABC transporter ATP-binding protein [Caballeronia sp. LZ035]
MELLLQTGEFFKRAGRALLLVWATSPAFLVGLLIATLIAGVLPAVAAVIGQRIVDAVVAATRGSVHGLHWPVARYLLLEALLLVALAASQRALSLLQNLLRARLGQKVNLLILEKAQKLSLVQFEDAEFYDRLVRVRRDASSRPLSLVMKSLGLVQNVIAVTSFAVLLVRFSPWALVILVVGAIPSFISEARFSGSAFRLFGRRTPESRQQNYIESLLSHEANIKEVKLFGFAPLLLQRYRDTFEKLYAEDRALTLRRDGWGFLLGVLGTIAFYAAYAWIVLETVNGAISLGQMTMYLVLFRQGQSAVSSSLSSIGGLYEDGLYLSDLFEFLAQPETIGIGHLTRGLHPGSGLKFDRVSFAYPGVERPALTDISFELKHGQTLALVGENGSGKTTLIKLLTRLYTPSSGRILLDGTDLREWDEYALRRRIGVILQDFIRYQFKVGENLGVGDIEAFSDKTRWSEAARKGMAAAFIEQMKNGYETQLGRWFAGGRELSGGQWQKIALLRAYMRESADILILDEPTAALDPEAEAGVFAQFQAQSGQRMSILISHRFSSVRGADQIVVLDEGRILERGSHAQLLARNGRYAHLFGLQAEGYQ